MGLADQRFKISHGDLTRSRHGTGNLHPARLLGQWAGLTKWGLLGIVFLTFVLLFRPHRVSGRWTSLLRAATRPSREPSEGSLSVERVLTEEYECLHGPLNGPVGLGWLYEAIHDLREKRSALCLSGGGIRSATFALGVLQGLAKVKVLPQFHYLSTVSGGGYIGGWLTAWLHHSRDDVAVVAAALAALDSSDKLDPEPSPVSHLRDYSNYLAPRSGAPRRHDPA